VLVEWPQKIDKDILINIIFFRSKIQSNIGEFVLDTVPAYSSLTIFFDTSKIKYSSMVKYLKEIYEIKNQKLLIVNKLWKIPVCYDIEFGIDLELIAEKKNISIEKIIEIHSSSIYDVYFIGFFPGFLYLGGLPKKIHFKRKSKPRLKINKGDVGIAGDQTGIYPRTSPGGWNIIGNSPLHFFDVNKSPPCFAIPGDKIQFRVVDKKEYYEIEKLVNSGKYSIESETYG
jgi:KipI family sensor histidine kinase inhibitor